MKISIKILLIIGLSILLASCSDDSTKDVSRVTYYVEIKLVKDSAYYLLPLGKPYIEPGYIGIEDGQDVTSKIKVEGNVDYNKIGLYNINYTAVNKDGFSSSVARTVVVYDPSISIQLSGNYKTMPGTKRIDNTSETTKDFSKECNITLTEVAAGIYSVSDLLGGYYSQIVYPQYGARAAMKGYISVNKDNNLTLLQSNIELFEDSLDNFSGKVEASGKKIEWIAKYASRYDFDIFLESKAE